MRTSVFLQSLICLLAVSCSFYDLDVDSMVSPEDEVFFASMEPCYEPETRVYLGESSGILWEANDLISIFNKKTLNQQYMFTGETGDNSGSFKKVSTPSGIGTGIPFISAVYPYSASTKISNSGVMTLTLPEKQTYREDSFGRGANTMVSTTENNNLQFKNVGGYLVLKFYGDDVSVSSIKLEGNSGERLSGTATLTPTVGTNPEITMASTAGTSITLNCENPVRLGTTKEDATMFWLVVPPTNFTKGFKLTVTDPDGNVFIKETSANLSITRNGVLRIAAIKADFPNGHQSEYHDQYLTFDIVEGGTITWKSSSDFVQTIEYSVNGRSWNRLTATMSGVSFNVSTGDVVRFRGNNTRYASGPFSYNSFVTTCKFNLKGNIMSLVSGDNFASSSSLSSTYVFESLFYQCSGLLSAEKLVLPSSGLTSYCFDGLFYNCTSLKKGPDLPAKSLADHCYRNMFFGCSSLESAPKLPATSLANSCYSMMFGDCTSLKSAPELPAMTLANYCYSSMFQNCSALTSAPQLPATTLANNCYTMMFMNCTSLTTSPVLSATTLTARCYAMMFDGCSRLSSITCLANDISATNCLLDWVNNVSSSGTFVKAASMKSWPSGANGIPSGWTIRNSQ